MKRNEINLDIIQSKLNECKCPDLTGPDGKFKTMSKSVCKKYTDASKTLFESMSDFKALKPVLVDIIGIDNYKSLKTSLQASFKDDFSSRLDGMLERHFTYKPVCRMVWEELKKDSEFSVLCNLAQSDKSFTDASDFLSKYYPTKDSNGNILCVKSYVDTVNNNVVSVYRIKDNFTMSFGLSAMKSALTRYNDIVSSYYRDIKKTYKTYESDTVANVRPIESINSKKTSITKGDALKGDALKNSLIGVDINNLPTVSEYLQDLRDNDLKDTLNML